MIAANAGGKQVHRTTSTKISQTWFASQTGPIERLTSPRTRAPRSAPPAVRSQNPAPKSAPPEHRVRGEAGDDDAAESRASAHLRSRSRSSDLGRGPREPAQHVGHYGSEAEVDDRERRVAHRDALGARDRLLGAHQLVDDPGLAPDLGHDPARDQRHQRQAGRRRPRRAGTTCDAGSVPRRHRDHRNQAATAASSVPMPTITWNELRTTPTGGRSSLRNRVEPLDLGVGVVEGEQREQLRDLDAAVHLAVDVDPAHREARAVGRLVESLDRRELGRLAPRRPCAPPSRRRRSARAPPGRRTASGITSPARW